MTKDEVLQAEAQLRKDGYVTQANMILELAKELKVMTRAYDELYQLHYSRSPTPVYAHVRKEE